MLPVLKAQAAIKATDQAYSSAHSAFATENDVIKIDNDVIKVTLHRVDSSTETLLTMRSLARSGWATGPALAAYPGKQDLLTTVGGPDQT